MMRRFEHGIVLLNPTSATVHARLSRVYWQLRGDQDPSVNAGQPVRSLTMPPYTGQILLNGPQP
jgi:hypothetical protein